MKIYLLDVGKKQYGDCIVITQGGRTILVDGAHPKDDHLISGQLRKILNGAPPFKIDLLIVTHCHGDHIGCLPELIQDGVLQIAQALVADEQFGWGRDHDGASPHDAVTNENHQMLLAALHEEDYSNLSGADLLEVFEDVVKLEDKYKQMLKKLSDDGTKLIRYGRNANVLSTLEDEFSDFGLKILGPTTDHLILCADAIASASDMFVDRIERDLGTDTSMEDLEDEYKAIVRSTMDAASDRPGPGAARNDQSIVFSVSADGWKALLAGDMQFSKAEVPGLDEAMEALRQTIVDNGPYDFIKLSHHTSYNGVDETLLDEWNPTSLYGHTGGSNDPNHPEPDTLEMLKKRSRSDDLTLARTDRNGLIEITKKGGVVEMVPSKGRLNNFVPNVREDEETTALEPTPKTTQPTVQPEPSSITNPPVQEVSNTDGIEIHAKVPHVHTRVRITIDVNPGNGSADAKASVEKKNTSQFRNLSDILFLTCTQRLIANIGAIETEEVKEIISQRLNAKLIDVPAGVTVPAQVSQFTRNELKAGQYKGVVIVGGYDIIPPNRVDTIDAKLRQTLVDQGDDGRDADDFIVWSDDVYGDYDDDVLPELPVSRIPDGRNAQLVRTALTASAFSHQSKFGIRNIARPFANDIYNLIPGSSPSLEISQLCKPSLVKPGTAKGTVYYMLHGSDRDATKFWGEDESNSIYEAIELENIPETCQGSVVFTGCCWGALIAYPPAVRMVDPAQLRPRLVESSIPLKYLAGGANAFIGCTGSHYSPVIKPLNYYGGPLHARFWRNLGKGMEPARALFHARTDYAGDIPHGRTDPFSVAIELKIFNQFTCLGLGW